MPPALPAADVAARAQKGAWLVDVRDAKPFAAGHPAGAINIGIRGRFETWTGIMIPWGEPFVLVGSDGEVQEAAFRLKRIGYDAPAGFLKGGLDAWKQANLPVGSLKLVKPAGPPSADAGRHGPDHRGRASADRVDGPAHRQRAEHPVEQAVRRRQTPVQGHAGPHRVQLGLSLEHGGGRAPEDGFQERPQHGGWQRGMDCRRPADPERCRERTRFGRRPPREPSSSRNGWPPRSSNAC